ncbi:MAG: hypothetical protein U1B80_08365, partial [Anaerolineaceae bacterium]|nr:hypothetical protein [Anaerolineaceae bacterium]
MLDTLIIGYGNPSRQDDGVAWHILHQIAQEIGIDPELLNDGALDLGHASTHLLYRPQLTPELAEIIGNYSRVCFIDCHTGNIPQDTQFIPLNSEYQP